MSHAGSPSDHDPRRRRIQMIVVVLLAIVSVATSVVLAITRQGGQVGTSGAPHQLLPEDQAPRQRP